VLLWGDGRSSSAIGICSAALLTIGIGLACSLSSAQAEPLTLLDSRGWEMVSPVEKNGGEVQGFGANAGGDVLQAAADGETATFSSASSFGGEAQGAPVASQYISRRTGSGWITEDVTLPTVSGAYGEEPAGVPYRLFSGDLARGLLLNGQSCAEQPDCPGGYSLRQSAGGALTPSPEEPDLRFAGASPDLRHVILSTCAALTPDATEIPEGEGCDPTARNLYEWSNGQLALINLLPGESHGTPFASLPVQSGAVSEDGSRVYWTLPGGPLYLREAGATRQLDEALSGEFQIATPDGAFAFFIKDEHLYRYEAVTGKSTFFFLAPGGVGAGFGGLLGLVGISRDGSHIYYVGGNGSLYLRHGEIDTLVAASADPSNYPPAIGTARVSDDGTRLAFLSSAPLTGYDNTDRDTGAPDSEVFLFDATANGGAGKLTCVSCNAEGVAPIGPSSIPGAIANGAGPYGTLAYKPRVLTDGGNRLFFDSRDALVTQDTNNDDDVYEWEAQGTGSCAQAGGCLQLISSGRSEDGASFVDASANGRDAFFLTDGSLVESDPGAIDLYDAREGGGFPVPPKPIPCEGDACQPLPSPPEDPTPGTLVPTEGNPPVRFPPKACQKGKHQVKRHGKATCAGRHSGNKKHGKGGGK
jgi:hypothetical protein